MHVKLYALNAIQSWHDAASLALTCISGDSWSLPTGTAKVIEKLEPKLKSWSKNPEHETHVLVWFCTSSTGQKLCNPNATWSFGHGGCLAARLALGQYKQSFQDSASAAQLQAA